MNHEHKTAIFATLTFSWLGTAGAWLVNHGLSVLCAAVSIVASIHAIRASRAKLKYFERKQKEESHE